MGSTYEELRPEDRRLVDSMAKYIIACGMLQAIRSGDIASAQDAMLGIAKQYGIRLEDGEDRWKFQEACRKAAIGQLVREGLVTEAEDEHGVKAYRVAEGKEQEYKDAIYRAAYGRDVMDGCSATFKLVEKAENARAAAHAAIAAVRPVAEKIKAAGHILAFMDAMKESLDAAGGKLKTLGDAAASEVAEAVYKDAEKSDEIRSAFKDGKKAIDSCRDEIRKKMPQKLGASVAEAAFTEKQEKKFARRTGLSDGGQMRAPKLIDFAAREKEIKSGHASDIYSAFLDADRIIRPGMPPISRSEVSPETQAETKFRFAARIPMAISAINAAAGLRNLVVIQAPHRAITWVLEKTGGSRESQGWLRKRLEQARNGLQGVARGGWFREDPLGALVMKINGFNYDNKESRSRGRNYADQYGQLNVYRCGISKCLVSSLNIFHMADLDRAWAAAYLTAAMTESMNGVRYDKRGLEEKAEALLRSRIGEPTEENAAKAREEMEKELIEKHGSMVRSINEKRIAEGLPPLYETTPFNKAFGNPADSGEKDHVDVIRVTPEKFPELDVEQLVRDGRDGFYIDCGDSAALFLFSETKGVAAVLDEYRMPLEMRLTADTSHAVNKGKERAMQAFAGRRNELWADLSVRSIGKEAGCKMERDMLKADWRPMMDKLVSMGIRPKIVGREVLAAIRDPRTGLEHELGSDPEREYRDFMGQVKVKSCEEILRASGEPEGYIRHVIEKDPELVSHIYACSNARRGDDGIIRGVLHAEGDSRGAEFAVIDGEAQLIGADGRPDAKLTMSLMDGRLGPEWKEAIEGLRAAAVQPDTPKNWLDGFLMDDGEKDREDARTASRDDGPER